jgi:hypothetical protein
VTIKTVTFTGFVSAFDLKMPVNGDMTADCKIKPTGAVTIT